MERKKTVNNQPNLARVNPQIANEYFSYLNDINAATLQNNQRIYEYQTGKLRELQDAQAHLQQHLESATGNLQLRENDMNRQMNRDGKKIQPDWLKFDQLMHLTSAYNNHISQSALGPNQSMPNFRQYDPVGAFQNELYSNNRMYQQRQASMQLPQNNLPPPMTMTPVQNNRYGSTSNLNQLATIAQKNLSMMSQQDPKSANYGVKSYKQQRGEYMYEKEQQYIANNYPSNMANALSKLDQQNQLTYEKSKQAKKGSFMGEDLSGYQERMFLEKHIQDLEVQNKQLKESESIAHQFLSEPLINQKNGIAKLLTQNPKRGEVPFLVPFNHALSSQVVGDIANSYYKMKRENILMKKELGVAVGIDYLEKKLAGHKGLEMERDQLLAQVKAYETRNRELEEMLNDNSQNSNSVRGTSKRSTKKNTVVPSAKSIPRSYKKVFRSAVNMVLFGRYYFKHIMTRKLHEIRMAKQNELVSKMTSVSANLIEWIKTASQNGLDKLKASKTDLPLKKGSKVYQGKDRDKRLDEQKIIVKNIFDGLLDNFDPKKMGPDTMRLLRNFCTSGCHIPSNYLLRFELNRLQFSSYGATKNMNQRMSNMMLIGFILVRLLLFRIVLVIWNHDANPQKAKTPLLMENSTLIGSIMHWLMVEMIEMSCPVHPHNVANITPECRPSIRKEPLVAPERQVDSIVMNLFRKGEAEDNLILGLVPKEQLSYLFEKDTAWCQNIQAIIETIGLKFQEAYNA